MARVGIVASGGLYPIPRYPSAPLQNASRIRLNASGASMLAQCPACSRKTAVQPGSLLFHSFTASCAMGRSSSPHPISRG